MSTDMPRRERPGAQALARGILPAALCAVLLVGLASGCARAPSSSAENGGAAESILLRGSGPEPDSLDPQKARTFQAQDILRDLYECLTSVAKDGSVAPGVASSWSASPDGKTNTFHLRPEARWSNGDRVVGADFVAALRRLVDPATASAYAQVVEVIAHAQQITAGKAPPASLGVAAPDDATVTVTLEAPAPYLPALLANPSTCPVHRPTLARYGSSFTRPGIMVSNGAFVLKDWVPGSHLIATRNHRYWNDAHTRLDGVEYLVIPDEHAEFTRYRAGDLDISAVVPRDDLEWIRANIPRELHISPQLTTYFYGFNLDRAVFRDSPGLRRALSMVIDRELLAKQVLRAGEQPAYGWVPPGIHDYTAQSFDYRAVPLAERIARARELYRAAGYSPEHPLRFELRYNANQINDRIALAVTAMWKETLGVEAQLVAVEFRTLLQDIDRRDVDVFLSSWEGDYNDAYTFAQYFKSDFGVNLTHYRSAAYDSLVERAAAEADPLKRRALLEQAEQRVLADQPLIPIYFYVNKHLVKPRVQGWYDNALNVVYSKDLALAPGATR
ncbi:MAG TPA: peptide ABC transporter substrate-binding protein [Steroidobacteraceae bacterium]|nr:peptide ABC transporter substrate-binding protein [Steroidobacteraceae bacterium]